MSGWHEGGAGPSWEEHHAQLDALIAQLHAKAWIVAGGQAKDQPTTGRPSKGLAAEEALDVCYRDEGVTGSFSCLGIPQPHPPRLQSEPPSKPNPPADLEHDHLNRRHKLPDVMPLLLGGRRPLGGILCTRTPSERVADGFCEGVPAEGFEKEVMVTAEKISRTLDTLQAFWSSWSSGDAVEGSQNCPPAPATRSVGSAGPLSNRSMLQTPSESRGGWSDPEQSQLFQIPQKNLEQLRQEAARRQVLEALGKPPRSRGPRGFRGAEDWEGATQEAVQATRGARLLCAWSCKDGKPWCDKETSQTWAGLARNQSFASQGSLAGLRQDPPAEAAEKSGMPGAPRHSIPCGNPGAKVNAKAKGSCQSPT